MTLTSSAALGTPAMRIPAGTLDNVSDISARFTGFRLLLPLKMRSVIRVLRRVLDLCSPMTQRIASETLLFPQPLGPTMAVKPFLNSRLVESTNDLKPSISKFFRYMRSSAPGIIGCLESHIQEKDYPNLVIL